MKDKKNVRLGFSLIELLGVIILLAVLALIATPIILDIVNNSKREAMKDTAYGLINGARNYTISNISDSPWSGKTFTITDGEFVGDNLDMGGEIPEDGTIAVNANLDIAIAVVDGHWCAKKNYNEKEITISDDIANCTIEEEEATTKSCFAFDNTTGTITSYYEYEGNNSENAACSNDVVIPSQIDGVNVTTIGPGAFITKVKNAHKCRTYNPETKVYGSYVDVGLNYIHADSDGYYECAFDIDMTTPGRLTSVSIPTGITQIKYDAFKNNQLTSINIPNTVTLIGRMAFRKNGLTSLVLPNSVTTMETGPFYDNLITNVTLSNNLSAISPYAFYNNKIENLTIPNGITSIGYASFYNNIITNINLPNGVTSIDTYAFTYNQLSMIDFPDDLVSIGDWAFYSNKLTSVVLPNSVTTLGEFVFFNNQITNATLSSSLATIETSVFRDNVLSSIVIPNSVTYIGTFAFGGNQLTSATLSNTLITIDQYAFDENLLQSITIPSSVTTIWPTAFYDNNFGTVTIKYNGTNLANRFNGSLAGIGWGSATMNYVSD